MYRDKNGLITVDEGGTSAENSFLWTVELFIVQHKQGNNTDSLCFTIDKALEDMDLGKGLYKQAPHIGLDQGHDSYMSHDQLTAIICYLSIKGRKDKIKEILKAFKYGISYNNVDSKFRPMHPRDLIFYNIMNGSILAWLLLPLLLLITFITFKQNIKKRNGVELQKTDGEILYYIKRECTNAFRPVNSYCESRVKSRFGSWDKLFNVYFRDDNHPINLIENK